MQPDALIVKALEAGGYLPPGAAPRLRRLAGGVSSDVFRLDGPDGVVCVKRAIPVLRTAVDWRAPLERSHYEAEWLRLARGLVGPAVPEVLFESAEDHLFVMTWFDPADHSLWKTDLAAGRIDLAFARQVGALMATFHGGTSSPHLAERFPTAALFEALRLSPYLRHTALAHPDLASRLLALAERTASTRTALVHGDVSPKNILHGPAGPVLLDAECAWYGDPAFDLAFCSTHLLLKTVWKPAHASALLDAFDQLQAGYGADPAVDARAAALTSALLLARIDGKSPVEYLQEDQRAFVRQEARRLVAADLSGMAELAARWSAGLGGA